MKITLKNIIDEAFKGNLEVLTHKDAFTFKDIGGITSLHYLASFGKIEVLNHKEAYTLKDDEGLTPLHYLVRRMAVPRDYIKKTFPWFKLGKRKINGKLITEILETNNACKFIKTI